MPTDHRAALANIKSFPQLIAYLRDEMGWPIARDSFEDVDDLFYDFTADELGIDPKTAAKIQEIKRLRPLSPKQPWGIFFVKFEPKKLPVVALRRILSQVALKKRASANSAERVAWAADDLLFVSNYGEGDERQISFAHFSRAQDGHDLPTLKVLGWDNLDTALHLDAVAKELTLHLAWPDDDTDVEAWRKSWRGAFTLRHGQVVTTSKELSIRLAELARNIRDRIKTALAIETDKGLLTRLMKAFQTALVHDLDADGFADMYAQTIAYGLLSARIADPHKKTADDFAAHMRTNPFLRELMETFLKVGGRRGKAGGPGIDFDELGVSEVVELLDDANMEAVVRDFGDRNPQEDPVIHFYEHFLAAYDKKQKVRRGVFYTPRPVVSYIVRSVDELLRTEFGLADGLADTTTWDEMAKRHKDLKIPEGVSPGQDFVQILDPATGTGTFLVEVIDLIHKTLVAKWEAQGHGERKIDTLWNEYVPKHLLTRLHGYELLMAPYAIAHLKIGLTLYETGYRFGSDERAHVYLTDALEPAKDFSGLLEFAVPALAHEAKAVNEVKRCRRFTVVVGNPPYLREKDRGPGQRLERIGGWVRFGDDSKHPLFDDFIKPLAERGLGVHAKLAYELSVVFWRLALWLACERSPGPGIVGMISPRAYVSGPGHTGVRLLLRGHASGIWITDLGGDNRGARKSENVFDIETGVCIGLCVRRPGTVPSTCVVKYAEVDGASEAKLQALNAKDLFQLAAWRECQPGADTFLPVVSGDYTTWPALTDILPWQHSGSQFKRLWPIGETSKVLLRRWRELLSLPRSARTKAFVETRDRLAASAAAGRATKKLTGISDLPADAPAPKMLRYCYRALDRQWCFADERLADFLRPSLVRVVGPNQVFAATLMSKPLGQGPAVTVTSCLPDMDVFCNRGAKDVVPLWRDAAGEEANVTRDVLPTLSDALGIVVRAEDLFCYCVAILGSPHYAAKFETELASPGIRIPIAKCADTFRAGSELGAEFVWFQTFGERWLGTGAPPAKTLSGRARVRKPVSTGRADYPNTFEYDPSSEVLKVGDGSLSDVAPEVYGYAESGLKVVQSWLRYRMAVRGGRAGRTGSRSPLDEIRPTTWVFTDELLELLWVVEGCVGLWPKLGALLEAAATGACFRASELPMPTEQERSEPAGPNSGKEDLFA